MPFPDMSISRPVGASDHFVDELKSHVLGLKAGIKADETFVCEYVHGYEVIRIFNVGVQGRDMVRMVGIDKAEQVCYLLAPVATLTLLFRVSKKPAETGTASPRREYGFVVEASE
jgi:hypothetical protein